MLLGLACASQGAKKWFGRAVFRQQDRLDGGHAYEPLEASGARLLRAYVHLHPSLATLLTPSTYHLVAQEGSSTVMTRQAGHQPPGALQYQYYLWLSSITTAKGSSGNLSPPRKNTRPHKRQKTTHRSDFHFCNNTKTPQKGLLLACAPTAHTRGSPHLEILKVRR